MPPRKHHTRTVEFTVAYGRRFPDHIQGDGHDQAILPMAPVNALLPLMPAPVPAPAPNLAVPTAPTRKGPETVLDERPLKITMYVEAVRLIERAKPKAAR